MAWGIPCEKIQARAKEAGKKGGYLVPCEGERKAKAFVKNHKLPREYVERMNSLTLYRRECCWIACPLFGECDHLGWKMQVRPREESLEIFEDFLQHTDDMDQFFTEKEEAFIWDLLDRLEASEDFSPSESQMRWLQSLHERLLSRAKRKER